MIAIKLRPLLSGAALAAGIAGAAAAFDEADRARIAAAFAAGEPVVCPACNLSYANLSGLDLSGADLAGAYLYGARLRETVLRGATLDRADLTRADLTGADMTGATTDEMRMVSARRCRTLMPDGAADDRHC